MPTGSTEGELEVIDMTPAKRCSDFDDDCAGVVDHYQCWKGGPCLWNGQPDVMPPADGYCPYLIGQLRAPSGRGE